MNKIDEDIDIFEAIITIWRNKFKVLTVTVITLVVSLFLFDKENEIPKTLVTTEIRPISTFDEIEYDTYNAYLSQINSKSIALNTYNYIFLNEMLKIESPSTFKNFKKINKILLQNLFLDRLNENETYKNGIRKFKFLNKENYKNDKEYEDAVTQLASKIKLLPPDGNEGDRLSYWNIQFKVENTATWNKFLKYVEVSINEEIQSYLNDTFNNLILTAKTLNQFEIEDIEIEIRNVGEFVKLDDPKFANYLSELEKYKKMLIENKDIERFQKIFLGTPIAKSNKFHASKIMVESSKYETSTSSSKNKTVILSIIIGIIFGIFFVLFQTAFKNRS